MQAVAARQPQQLHELFAQAANAGDVDGVLALYEPGAAVLDQPGRKLTDPADLRKAVTRFIGQISFIKVETIEVLQSGGLALLRSAWTMQEQGGGTISSRSIEVGRQQPDGTWRYVIDNPWAD